MKKTTAKDFQAFIAEHQRCVERFGLKEWRIEYKHEALNGQNAYTDMNLEGAVAKVILSTEIDDGIEKIARHEALHLLLGELYLLAGYRWASYQAIDTAEEQIVRRLENTL